MKNNADDTPSCCRGCAQDNMSCILTFVDIGGQKFFALLRELPSNAPFAFRHEWRNMFFFCVWETCFPHPFREAIVKFFDDHDEASLRTTMMAMVFSVFFIIYKVFFLLF